jgi:hypothetical protein
MSNGRKGKLVIQEIPTGEVERKVVRLLLKFAKNASVDELRHKVRRTPYTLSSNIEAEKAALLIEAFEKFGATAAFVPHVVAEPVAEPFKPIISEPRFVMHQPTVAKQPPSGGSLQTQSPKSGVRNLTIFLVFILMMLSFGFLAWQLWPIMGGKIQGFVSYLKHLF